MRKFWSKEDIELLKRIYSDMQTIEVAKILNCNIDRVNNMAYKLRLKKSEEYYLSDKSGRLTGKDTRGLRSRFKKGHIPANKGKKWIEYMDKESIQGSLKTAYQKGHLPHNTKSNADISVRDDEGRKYKYIRISLGNWIPLHVHLWEKENGTIPKGMIVVFKDRNSMNCELSNLELITREENMNRNSFHRYPADLKFAIKKLNQFKRQINGKEQNSRPAGSSV